MFGSVPYIPIILGVLFVISMINVILHTTRQKKRRVQMQNRIVNDGYMKLFVQLEAGRGEITVHSVDDRPPLHSSEVIQKAIFLSPGEHKLMLTAKAKNESISDAVLPYQRDLGPFELTVLAKKDAVATLYLNVDTQNIYLKEREDD